MKNNRFVWAAIPLLIAALILTVIFVLNWTKGIRDKLGGDKASPEITYVGNNLVRITLGENPSTGYTWHYLIKNGNVAQVIHDEYISQNKNGIVGAGGIHTWDIRAEGEGTTLIRFNYYRSWEGAQNSAKTIVFGIYVDSAGKIYIKKG